jgi:hypothetical protein
MKNLIITALVIGGSFLAMPSFAQVATITDNTCTAASQCTAPTIACNSTTFTVPTSGNYHLKATIDECGASTACANCFSDTYIYKQDNPPSLVICVHSGCCSDQSGQVHLDTGIEYILYCCKVGCGDGGDCSECGGSCTARATVVAG